MKRYKQNQIEELAEILKNDGVISVPTDTVYGICARINSIEALNKLMMIKNRPTNKALPIMCANEEQIKSVAVVDEKTQKLIKAFMPGPVTLILKKRREIPDYVNNGKTTIAIRMATSKVLQDLIQKTGSPLFMSSANQSGEPTCRNLDEIEKSCPNLDGMLEGNILYCQPSTIIDCSTDKVTIIREGPITNEQIRTALEK